jgi:hypothetical protein
MILGLSVLMYKTSVFCSSSGLQESGFIGINEKELVKSFVPGPIYSGLEKVGTFLKKPEFVEYDESKRKRDIKWNDKEGYKGSIDMIFGTLYFMSILLIFFAIYELIKYFIRKLYTTKETLRPAYFNNKRENNVSIKVNKSSLVRKEIKEFLIETYISIKKGDKRDIKIVMLSLLLITLLTIKVNFNC